MRKPWSSGGRRGGRGSRSDRGRQERSTVDKDSGETENGGDIEGEGEGLGLGLEGEDDCKECSVVSL